MNTKVFEAFTELQTERLTLRSLDEKQLEALKEIASFKVPDATAADVRNLLEKTETEYAAQRGITWGLYHHGILIGTCGYYRGFANDSGEIGYVMRAAYRRKGFMKEAVEAVVSFGFTQMELVEVTAYTRDDNLPSIELLRSFGFRATDKMHEAYRRFELKA